MILNDILSSDAYTPVNKKIAKELGFLVAGYFGELIRQRERFGQEEFYFSQKQIEEEIGISCSDQRNSLKKLIESEFISVKKKGLPAQYWFTINDYKVLLFFSIALPSVLGKTDHQSFKKQSTSASKIVGHNKNNNKKDNNISSKEDISGENFFENEKINSAFLEFRENRKQMKKKMTDLATQKVVKKINSYILKYSEDQILYFIDSAIEHGWQGIFETFPKDGLGAKKKSKLATEADRNDLTF